MTASNWEIAKSSVQGTSHIENDVPCQDSHRVESQLAMDGEVLLVICADGAGSAELAHLGSEIACDAVIDAQLEFFAKGGAFSDLCDEIVLRFCEAARYKLQEQADIHAVPLRQLACTLIGTVLSSEGAWFFQIGDGAIVCIIGGQCGVVFWPQAGEFAGTTHFLTDTEWRSHIQITSTTKPVDCLAVFSDGVERLILEFATKTPHLPFLLPLWKQLGNRPHEAEIDRQLAAFLDSNGVNERTDDDKTLVLVIRNVTNPPTPA